MTDVLVERPCAHYFTPRPTPVWQCHHCAAEIFDVLMARDARISELERALLALADAVGGMKVPQNTAEAGLQIMFTIGPVLEHARAARAGGDRG